MFSEQRVTLKRLRLSSVSGPENGPPLALLHGVTRRWQSFLPVLPQLSMRWQIMAWDARGHGLSDGGSGYRVSDYVEDACGFVRSEFNRPGVLYGHSLGAMVALATAAELPEMVSAVVLEDPPFDSMGTPIRETPLYSFFSGLVRFAGHKRPVQEVAKELAEIPIGIPGRGPTTRLGDARDMTSLRFTAQCLTQMAPQVLTPILDGTWLVGFDRESIVKRVTCPVLLLQADSACGGMLTDLDAASLTATLPDCTRVRFPNSPHLIHWAQTDALLRQVVGFLESL